MTTLKRLQLLAFAFVLNGVIVRRLGVRYFFESHPIIELASKQSKPVTSICAWCARMKRGILYKTARREGYNVLVLGQHLDDMVCTMGYLRFGPIEEYYVFCDLSVRKKDWRNRARGAKAT